MADNSERIDKFLHEQMTPEDNEAFLKDLRTDKELRDEAQAMALLIKEMREEQAKQDKAVIQEIQTSDSEIGWRLTGFTYSGSVDFRDLVGAARNMIKWVGSIAAMFIIFWGGIQIYTSYSIDKVFDEYYEPYESHLSKGLDDEVIQKELAELYNKIAIEKDVTPIITRLQTIYDNIQSNNEDYLDYGYYENDIAWYLALAYIKDHKLDKARELLKLLAEEEDAEAEELLDAIEKLQK